MGKIEEANKQLITDFMETFSTGNIDAFMEYLSDSATWWVAGTIEGISGEKNMKEFREMNSGIATSTKTGAIQFDSSRYDSRRRPSCCRDRVLCRVK